jgi:type I restriction enzyme S subunit
MSEWREYKLGELVALNERSIGRNFKFDRIEYIDTSSVTENKFETPILTTLEDAPSRAKRLIVDGDTIISTVRPIQKHYGFIKKAKDNQVVSTGFVVVTPKKIEPRFLYYFLTQAEVTEYLNTIAEGGTTTFPAFKADELKDLPINLPDYDTQIAIAGILSSLDDKIELNNKINQELETLAQTLFKQWFIDFEFPNENGEPYKSSGGELVESELGEIPKGWEVSEIGLVAKLGAGGDKPSRVSEVQTQEFNIPIYSNGISQDGLYGYTDEAKIFEESVTISARGTIGFVCLRTTPFVPIVRLISVIADEKFLSTKFLYMWLKNQNIVGNGTTQQQLTVPDFKSSKITIPQLSVVNAFSKQMDLIVETINFNKKDNQELTNLRDTLLPKLISGELSLNEISNQ